MLSTITFGAIALAAFAVADVTGKPKKLHLNQSTTAVLTRLTVTVTEKSTITAADCSASECNPPAGTTNALSVLESAAGDDALSILIPALTLESPITFAPSVWSMYGGTPGSVITVTVQGPAAYTTVPTPSAISTSAAQTPPPSTESLPSVTSGPPVYSAPYDTTTVVSGTSIVDTTTAVVPAPSSSIASPGATTDTTVAPGAPVSSTSTSTEGASTPASSNTETGPTTGQSSTLVTSTSAPSATESSSTNEVGGTTSAISTEAPPQQTGGAIDMKAPGFIGMAAGVAALMYI